MKVSFAFEEKSGEETRGHSLALHALLTGLIDYAGLFPPAGLGMFESVSNYERYLQGEHAWMLGRFVLPVARLDEFVAAQANAAAPTPWRLSALLGDNPARDMIAIDEFNRMNPGTIIDTVEMKSASAQAILAVQKMLPGGLTVFHEISPENARELLPVLRKSGGRAKIRTGGVTPEMIPSTRDVAGFLVECKHAGVPFKATAGLHHPMRGEHVLTYEEHAPRATMHGFLNVFAAAVLARCARDEQILGEGIECLLSSEQIDAFEFSDEVRINVKCDGDDGYLRAVLTSNSVESARQNFAISFGSCSFEGPITELRQLQLL